MSDNKSNHSGLLVNQFRSIFPDVSNARARELIEASSGNVDRAINLYLSQSSNVHVSDHGSVPASHLPDASSTEEADELTVLHHGDAFRNKKRKAASPSTSTAAVAASPSKRAKGKKDSSTDSNQHALTSFFTRSPVGASTAAAAVVSARKIPTANLGARMNAASSSATQHDSPAAPATASAVLSLISDDPTGDSSSDADPLRPCWKPGESVPFIFLSRIYSLIESENGRILKTNYLTYCFWQILAFTPADLPAALFLSSDQLAPAYENHQLGIGGSSLVSLVSDITSVSRAKLYQDHTRLGDLGLIASQYRLTQKLLFRPAPLTVAGVFNTMNTIGHTPKKDRKEDMLVSLFHAQLMSIHILVVPVLGCLLFRVPFPLCRGNYLCPRERGSCVI
jgi:hypothetical protein